jgi:hypothetical protein
MLKVLFVAPMLLAGSTLVAYAQVPGSYRQSCSGVSQDGSLLNAECRGTDGRTYSTTIDVARCGRNGIVNNGGRLACGNVRGSARPVERGRGYEGDGRDYDRPREFRPRYAPPDRGYDQEDDGGYRPPPRRYAPPGAYDD